LRPPAIGIEVDGAAFVDEPIALGILSQSAKLDRASARTGTNSRRIAGSIPGFRAEARFHLSSRDGNPGTVKSFIVGENSKTQIRLLPQLPHRLKKRHYILHRRVVLDVMRRGDDIAAALAEDAGDALDFGFHLLNCAVRQ